MSLIITAAIATCGVMIGRTLVHAVRRKAAANAPVEGESAGATSASGPAFTTASTTNPAAAATEETHRLPEGVFPCNVGDVLLRSRTEEAWLAGAVLFSEDAPVAVLFVAPEAGGDRYVYARRAPEEELYWLAPCDAAFASFASDPPQAVERGDVRFERVRRLPLTTRKLGAGAPNFGGTAVIAEYTSAGFERLVLIAHGGSVHAYEGSVLEPGMYEVLPGDGEK